mgnify:CR=1 FL=1
MGGPSASFGLPFSSPDALLTVLLLVCSCLIVVQTQPVDRLFRVQARKSAVVAFLDRASVISSGYGPSVAQVVAPHEE